MIKNLKVGCRIFNVEYEDAFDALSEGRNGDIRIDQGIIRVANNLRPDKEAEVLVHEILHALISDAALDWPREEEEKFVARVTPRLAAFIADNPKVITEILKLFHIHRTQV